MRHLAGAYPPSLPAQEGKAENPAIRVLMPFVGTVVGGATVSAGEMARRLTQAGAANVVVLVPGDGPGPQLFEKAGAQVANYAGRATAATVLPSTDNLFAKLKALPAWMKLYSDAREALALHRPDVLHINEDRLVVPWAWEARRANVPVVWHVRQERPNRVLDRQRLQLADHLIFVADANRTRFPRLPVGLNTTTIHNVVNLDRFYPPDSKKSVRKSLGLDPDKLTLTFLGNLVERKRPDWVLRATALLQDRYDLQVLLIGAPLGPSAYIDGLRELVESAPNPEDIHLLGHRQDVPDLLRASDVVTLPSVPRGEAFPRAVIESMASGVPPVATNVAGVAEAVNHEETGLLVDPTSFDDYVQALDRLLADGHRRRQMGSAARTTALAKFSGQDMVPRLMAIYRPLIEHR